MCVCFKVHEFGRKNGRGVGEELGEREWGTGNTVDPNTVYACMKFSNIKKKEFHMKSLYCKRECVVTL